MTLSNRLPESLKKKWIKFKIYAKVWEPERRLPFSTYYKQRRKLIQKIIKKYTTGRILLDIGVGKGRFSIPLSKNGYICIGIDISVSYTHLTLPTKRIV